jgi:3-oxoacyl-[acyl-carrier protein] reductase
MLSARSADALGDAENILRADGTTVASEAADVTQPAEAARLVQATVTVFGGIDILVNNVGGPGGRGRTIADSTDADWQNALDANLLQVVRMMRLALPHMPGRAGAAASSAMVVVSIVKSLQLDKPFCLPCGTCGRCGRIHKGASA